MLPADDQDGMPTDTLLLQRVGLVLTVQ